MHLENVDGLLVLYGMIVVCEASWRHGVIDADRMRMGYIGWYGCCM